MGLNRLNLSLILTIARLVLSPILIPILFVTILPQASTTASLLVALIFILLSLTDFFDGYFARKFNQETVLGKVLDPIADKFLVNSALFSLVYLNKLYFYWAIILSTRELFVMGL